MPAGAEEPDSLATLGLAYQRDIRPLLERFCLDCHSTQQQEGDFDLQQFAGLEQVRLDPQAWQKVDHMLETDEMPPEDNPQPSSQQQQTLQHKAGKVDHRTTHSGSAVCPEK